MELNYDPLTILGIRILTANPPNFIQYFVQYEIIGDNWKQIAKDKLSNIDHRYTRIQTAHPLKNSKNGEYIWIYNDTLFLVDL